MYFLRLSFFFLLTPQTLALFNFESHLKAAFTTKSLAVLAPGVLCLQSVLTWKWPSSGPKPDQSPHPKCLMLRSLAIWIVLSSTQCVWFITKICWECWKKIIFWRLMIPFFIIGRVPWCRLHPVDLAVPLTVFFYVPDNFAPGFSYPSVCRTVCPFMSFLGKKWFLCCSFATRPFPKKSTKCLQLHPHPNTSNTVASVEQFLFDLILWSPGCPEPPAALFRWLRSYLMLFPSGTIHADSAANLLFAPLLLGILVDNELTSAADWSKPMDNLYTDEITEEMKDASINPSFCIVRLESWESGFTRSSFFR